MQQVRGNGTRPGAVRGDRRLHRFAGAAGVRVRPAHRRHFCARVAGNFVNVDILGSLEFACEVAGAKAIVVLGHTSCGAIKSAIDGVKLGHITAMLGNLGAAVAGASQTTGPRKSDNAAFVQEVAETNARLTAASLTRRSAVLRKRVEAGNLTIAAAMHDLATGRVSWLS